MWIAYLDRLRTALQAYGSLACPGIYTENQSTIRRQIDYIKLISWETVAANARFVQHHLYLYSGVADILEV